MTDTAYIFMALIAGAFLSTQGLINGRLAGAFGTPVLAALISFGIGFLCLLMINAALLASRAAPMPQAAMAQGLPWWAWTGGLLGAGVVSLAAAGVPKLGAATYISAIICAQLITAAILDHIGAFGYAPRPISLVKLAGMACMGLGVLLIRKG